MLFLINSLRHHKYALSILLMAGLSQSQTAPLIANINGRQTTTLNGAWHVIVDPYDVGKLDYHARPLKNNNAFFKDHKPQSKSELVEYDFDHSPQLNVPGDWNTQRDTLLFYEGTVWYKQTFDYHKSSGERLFLYFGGANYQVDVYLNGELLGHHEGGFTPFDFEITDRVRESGNFVIVRVNDSRSADQVPAITADWWNYGGITRPVTLVRVPQTFIQDYFLHLEKGSAHNLRGWVQLDGPKFEQSVTIHIPEIGLTKVLQTDADGRAQISLNVNLTLWSPENPKLYRVEIATDTDRVVEEIGFRSIETKGKDILLNGMPVFLRGINIHEESPSRPARAWSEDDAKTLLGWAKELGCNFVRLAHYPHNEAMLRVADRMGLMVWAEIPVYWNIQWENPQTLHNAENQLKEMIARDHNRASVIIYSVANETEVSPARNAFLRQLIQDAHLSDPTRLVSAALQNQEVARGDRIVVSIDDPIANDLDVLGNNEYIGWYVHTPADADRTDWISNYDKPLIMSEFGGDALFGYHADALTRWSEEYQESLYQHQIAMLKRIPFLRGITPWILKDFRSPRRTLPGIQDYFNRKGLVNEHGDKKKAFFVLQKFYREVQGAQAR